MLQCSGPSGHGPGKHSSGHSKARRKERIQILKQKKNKIYGEKNHLGRKGGHGTQSWIGNYDSEIIRLKNHYVALLANIHVNI